MKTHESVLLIDIGSTFTKACAIDLENEELIASVISPSTVNTDVCEGIDDVINLLNKAIHKKIAYTHRLASSSAAGGLRMVVVGLVPDLTSEAGRLSALGAGAKVISTYSYKLNKNELREIENLSPDIILLVGGTDGGNEETILWNAKILNKINLYAPFIIAGNKVVAYEIKDILNSSGKDAFITENVLPEIGVLNVEPVRVMIRKIFIDRIIVSKGFEKVKKTSRIYLAP